MRRTFVLLLALLLLSACTRQPETPPPSRKQTLTVVTTLFPLYDFARQIGGDGVTVTLLLPPGTEAHSFEPRPSDLATVGKADIFIYTSPLMEPWAARILSAAGNPSLHAVEAGRGAKHIPSHHQHPHEGEAKGEGEEGHQGHRHDDQTLDPHIWLDFDNARLMVKTIADALAAKDPPHAERFHANAARIDRELTDLDTRFREGLSKCRTRKFVHGGHYAFGYLASRYGLDYRSAQAVNPDAEPTPAQLADLLKMVRKEKLTHVFAEEIVSPRIAEMIARETGVSILSLHGGHNLTSDDLKQGTTFTQLMERNLQALRTGLGCR